MTSSIVSVKGHDTKCSSICYDDQTNNVITVSHDGTVCVWSGLTSTCIETFEVSDSVNSMVYEKERIFIASSSNTIESYSLDNVDNVAVIGQFLSDVTGLRLSGDKRVLLACSSDNTSQVIDLSDGERRDRVLSGHENSVISVDVSEDGEIAATASCDGTVRLWRVNDGQELTVIRVLKVVNDASDARGRVRFNAGVGSGRRLAVVVAKAEVRVFECVGFTEKSVLRWDGADDEALTDVVFTRDGRHLVGSTDGGSVVVWDVVARVFLNSWTCPRRSAITGMLWQPQHDGTLLFCDASGHWEAVKVDFKKQQQQKKKEQPEKKATNRAAKKAREGVLTADEVNDMFDDFEGDDDEEDDGRSVASTARVHSGSEEEEEEEDEFDLSLIKAQFQEPPEGAAVPAPQALVAAPPAPARAPHPPVRPGATPLADGVRLLHWNSVAALKKHVDDNGDTEFLEVAFHDCARFRNIVLKPEVIDCAVGDVNGCALVLVSDQADAGDDDEDNEDEEQEAAKQAVVHVQSVTGAWPSWRAALPASEAAVACCVAGDLYAVVLTSAGFLRYFSLAVSGMQVLVESVPGRPVALVSSTEGPGAPRVAVVVELHQALVFRLEQLRPGRLLDQGRVAGALASEWLPLPLSDDDCRLAWVGFSDSGALYTVDSRHRCRRLLIDLEDGRFGTPRWTPVLDLAQVLAPERRRLDRHFPVGFLERGAAPEACGALTLLCRGARYPRLHPWPHLSVVPFAAPLCAPHDPATKAEHALAALNMLAPLDDEDSQRMLQDERLAVFNLFLSALKAGEDRRAEAVAGLMRDSRTVQLAIQAAVRLRRTGLAERLGELALQRDAEAAEGEDEEDKENDAPSDSEDEGKDEVDEEDARSDVSDTLAQRLVANLSPPPAAAPLQSPFRRAQAPPPPPSRRGIEAVDKLGAVASHAPAAAPRKSAMQFGSFVPAPSPGAKTFTIRAKRKSAAPPGGLSPAPKASRRA